MKLYYKVKQTMKNLQKYFHPSSLCKYAHCARSMPIAKQRSAEGSNFKEDDSAFTLYELLLYIYAPGPQEGKLFRIFEKSLCIPLGFVTV